MRFILSRKWIAALAITLSVPATIVQANEVVIDAIHALTGPFAFLGVPGTKAMQLAVEQLNASHFLGADTITLNVLDDASTSVQTLTLFNRAANRDKALVILGPSASGQAMAVGSAINDLQVPTITTAQTGEVLKTGPWYFKVTPNSQGQIGPLAAYAVDKLSLKHVASIYLRDNDGAISNMRTFIDSAKAHGAAVVAEEGVLTADTDFAAVSTKIAAQHPDGIFIGANAAQAANMAIQMRQAGVPATTKLFGSASLAEDYIHAGGAAVDNTYSVADYSISSKVPLNAAFVDSYRKRFGIDPDNWAAVGYTCVILAANAIKNAGPNPTRETVREAILHLHDIPVILGDGIWNMDKDRVPNYGIQVQVIRGGKIIPVN